MPSDTNLLPSRPSLGLPARRTTRLTDGLDAAGHGLLAALPAAMVLANRSSALVVICAALLIAAARLPAIHAADRGPLRAWLRDHRVVVALGLAAIAYALVSIAWSVDRAFSWRAASGAGLTAFACLALAACWRLRPPPPWATAALASGIGLGALLIVIELRLGYPIRRHLSDRLISFVQNRPTLTLVMLVCPVCALVRGRWRVGMRIGLGLAVLVAALTSTSGASKFGLAIGLAAAAASWLAPRWALRGGIVLLLGLVCVQPYFGEIADRVLPQRLVQASEAAHPRERIEIWRSYGEVARRRLATGTGFGSAPAAGRDPVAQEVAPEHRPMLDIGHPHDAMLQVWVELGLPGALALAGAILLTGAALARTQGATRHAGLATLMAASAISLVDHDAWQGWWMALIGLAAALLASRDTFEVRPIASTRQTA